MNEKKKLTILFSGEWKTIKLILILDYVTIVVRH